MRKIALLVIALLLSSSALPNPQKLDIDTKQLTKALQSAHKASFSPDEDTTIIYGGQDISRVALLHVHAPSKQIYPHSLTG